MTLRNTMGPKELMCKAIGDQICENWIAYPPSQAACISRSAFLTTCILNFGLTQILQSLVCTESCPAQDVQAKWGAWYLCFPCFFSRRPVYFFFLFCRYLTGQVDKRTLEKYEREAKEKNRETWYLSWALDTNQEERDKVGGNVVWVGHQCVM